MKRFTIIFTVLLFLAFGGTLLYVNMSPDFEEPKAFVGANENPDDPVWDMSMEDLLSLHPKAHDGEHFPGLLGQIQMVIFIAGHEHRLGTGQFRADVVVVDQFIEFHCCHTILQSQSISFCVTLRSSSRTSISAKPSRFCPRHFMGSWASGELAARRIPQMAS